MALNSVPARLIHYNIFVDGNPYWGLCTSINLPRLSMNIIQHRGGGMDMPYPVEGGMEPLEMSFTLSEHTEEIYSRFGFRLQGPFGAVFRGAKKRSGMTPAQPFWVKVRGFITELDPGEITPDGENPLNVKMDLTYYQLKDKGIERIEIDVENFIRKIDGVDQLLDVRAAILR